VRSRLAIAWAIALFVATALVVAACGGGDDNKSSNSSTTAAKKPSGTVTLWIMNNGPQPVPDMEKTVAPFTAKTGIKVKVELVGWDVQFDRIRNAAVSGEGPDITQAGTTQVPFFAALGGFDDLSKRVNDIGGQGAYPEGVWNTTKVAGQDGIYAVPWFTEARAIYYRKDVLEKAGVDPASAFNNWDNFRNTLQAIKDKVPTVGGKSIQPFGQPGKKAFDLVHHVMPFVWDAGGQELSDDLKTSTINSPQAQQGVTFFADLVKDGLMDKSQLERDGTQVENQFKGGKIAVWIGGPWVLSTVQRTDDKNWVPAARSNVGVAPMPEGPESQAFTFVGGSNLMMFKSSKNKDAAWELMKFLSQDQVQTDYANLMGMFPARKEAQQKVGQQDDNHQKFFAAIQQGRTYAAIPQWGQIENAYKTRFGNILDSAAGHGKTFSQSTVKSELDAAAKEANALLQQGG
jgi:multiple sugar transport system substrate-binding protein